MNHIVTRRGSMSLNSELSRWLDEYADGLDDGTTAPSSLLPMLVKAGLPKSGVPEDCGGSGGDITEAVASIAAVAEHSLAAGLVLWGHRTYIEYLLQSPNEQLSARLLPRLLTGELAGASGLSNAMKFLSGLEELQIRARHSVDGYILNGKLSWVTNLRPEGFHVAAAVQYPDGKGSFIASLASGNGGILRSSDLNLIALRSTNTAAITISSAPVYKEQILHPNAEEWLPAVRPAFLALQIGMSIGLAWRSLSEACQPVGAGRHLLDVPISALSQQLSELEQALFTGLKSRVFHSDPRPLFEIRIALAEVVAQAITLELHAAGGSAYLSSHRRGFARRLRESAFIPIITPSLLQLKLSLVQHKKGIDRAPLEDSACSAQSRFGIE